MTTYSIVMAGLDPATQRHAPLGSRIARRLPWKIEGTR
jgi:hypothetical protein